MGTKFLLIGEPMGLFIAKEPGPLSDVKDFSASVAGAEFNVAIGLKRLGHDVSFITKLGYDPNADRILSSMRQNGISDELILRDHEKLTGFMMKNMVQDADPEIFYYRKNSAASSVSVHDIDTLDMYGCTHLHITGIFPAVSQSAFESVKRLIGRAKNLDIFISFDPNLRPQLWKSQDEMVSSLNLIAKDADLILPGISEGQILTGTDTAKGIADFYHDMGIKNVIVKTGKDGAYHSVKDGISGYSPAFKVSKVVDTVGAGDGFAAGAISALAEGLSLREAAARGNVIGAIQVTNKSDNEGLPTRSQLDEIMERGHI